MKIAWLSSWPPRHCGIATYSGELVEALRQEHNDVHIICHPDGGSPNEKNVYPVIDTEHHGWDEVLFDTVAEINPDVLHIQHEYGLYNTSGDNASGLFRPLFRWKNERKFPVVVTYHSVYTKLSYMISSYMDVMQSIVDAGIVHAEYQWANLHANVSRIVDNVYVIPHGATVRKPISKTEAKDVLGLKGKKVVGMLGWFTETKGFHRVLKMWDELSARLGSDTVLVLAGDARHGDPSQNEYKKQLLELVETCEVKDRIKLVLGSFAPEDYDQMLASFDVMVMPYSFASQSGNLAHSFSHGVPVVITGIEGLKAEIESSGAGIAVPPGDDVELKRAISTIMQDDELRNEYSKRALDYVRTTIAWKITAQKHMKLYKGSIKNIQSPPKDLRKQALLETY